MFDTRSRLDFFIGPCMLESKELAEEIATSLVKEKIHQHPDINLTFKGSFDKANRSSFTSYRGPGIDEGLKILSMINKNYD